MPLDHYGVLAGTLTKHVRDTPDDQGRWYHVNLQVSAPAGSYRNAVDVDSKQSAVGVQWKVLVVRRSSILPAGGASPGYHELARARDAGALDHIRHLSLVDNPGCLFIVRPPGWLSGLFPRRPWIAGSNLEASVALESILVIGRRTLVWGEPFQTGLGMHNVHQNQGDPIDSQWAESNGIWQDGAVMVERPDGDYDAFISKFTSQSSRTDDAGHPV